MFERKRKPDPLNSTRNRDALRKSFKLALSENSHIHTDLHLRLHEHLSLHSILFFFIFKNRKVIEVGMASNVPMQTTMEPLSYDCPT